MHDLSMTVNRDTWALTFGVNNVFNEEPAVVDQNASGATQANGNEVLGSGYDIIGRRLFVNVTKEW